MAVALAEFHCRGICLVKVAVGAGNTSTIKFYQRCGFELTLTRPHHGRAMNIYTIDLKGMRTVAQAVAPGNLTAMALRHRSTTPPVAVTPSRPAEP